MKIVTIIWKGGGEGLTVHGEPTVDYAERTLYIFGEGAKTVVRVNLDEIRYWVETPFQDGEECQCENVS